MSFGILQNRYEIPDRVTGTLDVENGNREKRTSPAEDLQARPTRSPAGYTPLDTRIQRLHQTMGLQRPWCKRQQHSLHHRASARRRTLLVHGRLRAKDPLREPAHKTRVLNSSRTSNASSSLFVPLFFRKSARSQSFLPRDSPTNAGRVRV